MYSKILSIDRFVSDEYPNKFPQEKVVVKRKIYKVKIINIFVNYLLTYIFVGPPQKKESTCNTCFHFTILALRCLFFKLPKTKKTEVLSIGMFRPCKHKGL